MASVLILCPAADPVVFLPPYRFLLGMPHEEGLPFQLTLLRKWHAGERVALPRKPGRGAKPCLQLRSLEWGEPELDGTPCTANPKAMKEGPVAPASSQWRKQIAPDGFAAEEQRATQRALPPMACALVALHLGSSLPSLCQAPSLRQGAGRGNQQGQVAGRPRGQLGQCVCRSPLPTLAVPFLGSCVA